MESGEQQAYRKKFEIQWVYSYHEGWDVPLRAWVKLPYLPGFFIELQEALLFLFLEVIAYVLYQAGIGFRWLPQFVVIPIGLLLLFRRIKPEGKYLYQWVFSFIRFLLTSKETSGTLKPLENGSARLRILNRFYPGEKPRLKRKRSWFTRSKTAAS